MDDVCAWCGRKAAGYAFIDQSRYCHDDERSCYKEAQRAGINVINVISVDMSTSGKKERS